MDIEIQRNLVSPSFFNPSPWFPPYELRTSIFQEAMQDITHGARKQIMCVFVYDVDQKTEPAAKRRPMTFTEVYLGPVEIEDFRKNPRGELGTRTATLDAEGIRKLRAKWLYLVPEAKRPSA